MRRVHVVGVLVSVSSLLITLVACSNSVVTGSVSVGVTGLPVGLAPSVKLTNGSYSVVVTASQTVSGLPEGTYSVTPQAVALRGNVFSGTASSSTVTVGGGTTVSTAVTYVLQPGDLWASQGNNGGPNRYLGSSLYNGNPQAGTGISGLNYPYGMAFDVSGNFWVVNAGTNRVFEYSASSLASGTPAVVTSFSPGTNTGAEGIAFDKSGNLWLANNNSRAIVEYDAATLASGSPKVLLTITVPASSELLPSNLAFDANGNLWVAEPINPALGGYPSKVVEYTASSITSGTPVVGMTLSFANNVYDMGLAFDASGNLWVGLDQSVVEYTAASLATGTPASGITIPSATRNNPVGLAFDVYGNLWVANEFLNTIVEYTASSIASGSPVQGASFSAVTPIDLAFGPPPYNLPLSH